MAADHDFWECLDDCESCAAKRDEAVDRWEAERPEREQRARERADVAEMERLELLDADRRKMAAAWEDVAGAVAQMEPCADQGNYGAGYGEGE